MNEQQRAAMQMALEALEALKNTNSYWWQEVHESDLNNMFTAITALLEALAQPQEPVAWANKHGIKDWSKDFSAYQTQLYTIPVYTTQPSVEAAIERERLLAYAAKEMAVAGAIEATKEKAAKVCEAGKNMWIGEYHEEWNDACDDRAAAIRSMK